MSVFLHQFVPTKVVELVVPPTHFLFRAHCQGVATLHAVKHSLHLRLFCQRAFSINFIKITYDCTLSFMVKKDYMLT